MNIYLIDSYPIFPFKIILDRLDSYIKYNPTNPHFKYSSQLRADLDRYVDILKDR